MRLGVDFDNTIVCTDQIFHRAACERGWIPAQLSVRKDAVRDHLRAAGQGDRWTQLQGHVYGQRMAEAPPFPGALEALRDYAAAGIELCIISHKSLYPAGGPQVNLHEAALEWLRRHGLLEKLGIAPGRGLFFETTRAAKLARIRSWGCTHFIDDLPEVLSEPDFPADVARILFDPRGYSGTDPRWQRVESWAALQRLILTLAATEKAPAAPPPADSLCAAVSSLLRKSGGSGSIQLLQSLPAGGNNKVYLVESDGRKYLLKAYFHHADDPRDRLGTEFGFLRFAWAKGLRQAPRPIAADTPHGLALHEFIEGKRLQPEDIQPQWVDAALDFIRALNAHRHTQEAQALPNASEACFSIESHLACVEGRLGRLRTLSAGGEQARAAVAFVRELLAPVWEQVRTAIREQAAAAGLPLRGELPAAERIISPSDFGFHNALQLRDGMLRFIDFEYAGWDDPAKLASDFLIQPALPPPQSRHDDFVRGLANLTGEPDRFLRRAAILRPLYRIKWCCILLNEFLPVDWQRRLFANRELDETSRLERQLRKAREMLRQVMAPPG